MDLSMLKQGDEVIVFENYGRDSQQHVVDSVSRWSINMKDGVSHSNWDFPSKKKIVLVGSPEYMLAMSEYEAQSALDILRVKDAIANPGILAALKKCVALIDEDEVKLRHDRLLSMGATCSQEQYLYRNGTVKEKLD